MILSKSGKEYILPCVCILILFIIFHSIFFTEYAYLDEAHQLWHNQDGSNYTMFLVQGRALTGWIIDSLFGSISTIAALTYIRIISFAGWVITSIVLVVLLKKWIGTTSQPDTFLLTITSVLLCSSPSVAIYIGWGSCVEVFLAFLCGLISGDLIFSAARKRHEGNLRIPSYILLVAAVLGVLSLFLYQTAFGAFLLPFFVYYLDKRYEKADRTWVAGIIVYIVINLAYYGLFKYSLKAAGVAASDRTDLSFNIINKIGFFFSTPLAQAFSFNFLYNVSGLFSQVFYYATLAFWIVSTFVQHKEVRASKKVIHLVRTFFFLALIYLPILVARENFASYRTMLCLNLAVCILLVDAVLGWIKKVQFKRLFIYSLCGIFLIVGFFNFNINFVRPLKEEYSQLKEYVQKHYTTDTHTIYFIRPPESLFKTRWSVNVYRDEFGLPSTFKDWTPDPLVRQLITELTGDRKKAENLKIIQFIDKNDFEQQAIKEVPGVLIIDVETILNKVPK